MDLKWTLSFFYPLNTLLLITDEITQDSLFRSYNVLELVFLVDNASCTGPLNCRSVCVDASPSILKCISLKYKTKIPHTGDKASLDRGGQQHQCHRRVDQEYPKTQFFLKNGKNHPQRKNSKTSRNMPKLAIRLTLPPDCWKES